MKKLVIGGIFLSFFLLRASAVGWTPTDGGLVVNLEQGERFLLSVWVDKNGNGTEEDGEEFFVSNYTRYTGGYYSYGAGTYMKLLPATEVTEMNEWSVGAPLDRGDKSLGGIVYTIWNDGKTLKTSDAFKFLGELTDNYADGKACDVVFVIPTERGVPTVDKRTVPSFDPEGTLGRGKKPFNGRMGTGFLGMTYREVYMLQIPKANSPQSYTNAGLVTFNTTLSTWKLTSGAGDIAKGKAAYAYADSKHDKTPRTIFRLYLLDNPINSCSGYFFATDEQDYKRYRKNENNPQKSSDSTAAKKIYTMDRLMCMSRVGSTKYYQTDLMRVPEPDSTYYYVGYNNEYKDDDGESMGTSGAHSEFTKIRNLPLTNLPTFKAPAGAYGQIVVDTSSSDPNLGVAFEPAGYFLKVSTGKNVRMRKTGENEWTTQDMWTIDGSWVGHTIRATLMTGPEFSDEDPGVDIAGWSKDTLGSMVPVKNHPEWTPAGRSGYARIYTNRTDANGAMEFILANKDKHIHYDNNGFLGVEIPNQYPLEGATTTIVQAPRLKAGYVFDGWNTSSDGSGDTIRANTVLTLADITWIGDTVFNLYALAHYEGTLQVAISFIHPTDKKRYYLTHPNTSAPRYARARHFEDWENTWQGMENAENMDPNYISTFEMRYPINEINHKEPGEADLSPREKVLDPRRYVMKGYEDSLMFYEHFAPARDEYLGLYYTTPNTILANNTWAGLFETTSDATLTGWPDYQVPYIPSAKLKSIRYVEEYDKTKPDSLVIKRRSNSDQPWVHYNELDNQFDGVASEGDATEFEISAVIVADAHYIILPDTAYEWKDTIDFGYHKGEQLSEEVWSALIGKQLMAVMIVDGDTTYFHPNRKKIISDPNNLYLSPDFRVTQVLELIHDSRVSGALPEGDSVKHETTGYHWHNNIVSGLNSPMNVKDAGGNYINIVDTFRITVSHDAVSKIKEYRGYWNKNAAGLKVDNANGSVRHRDIIVRTKTYHYGDELKTRYTLKPEHDSYSFGPMAGQTKPIKFALYSETYREILDTANNKISEKVIQVDTLTKKLGMLSGGCSFNTGATYAVNAASDSIVTLRVTADNTINTNYDTLIISSISVDGVATAVEARVPLVQAALTTNELVWSVYDESAKKRYFIMAVGKDASYTLQFREFTQAKSMLYEQGTKNQLVKGSVLNGSGQGDNTDGKYITPWRIDYDEGDKNKLSLKTEYGISKYFATSGDAVGSTGTLSDGEVLFTYRIAEENTNDNSNYEEKVRIKYLDDKWLKFNGGVSPSITLQDDSASATEFSWTYLIREYNILNNGDYPSVNSAEFIYNVSTPKTIQTRYKAYREYSMLLDNELTYLCHEDENTIANLVNGSLDWKTFYTVERKADARTFDSGSTPSPAVSGLGLTTNTTTLTHTITPASATSPTNVKIGGKYVDIVDTLVFTLNDTCHYDYRFKGDWSDFKSISDANLKIPLVRKTYHEEAFSTLNCAVDGDDENFTFPASLAAKDSLHEYVLHTILHEGTQMLDVDGNVVAITSERFIDVTKDRLSDTTGMHLNEKQLAEVRLMDVNGNAPDWCEIANVSASSVTIKCKKKGVRSPRTANLYLAYIVTINGKARFVNYRLTVSQLSYFEYANNQTLIHSHGASGDDMMENGMQQVHTNKRVLYYYPKQEIELPVRERAFYGWWRWYREGVDVDGVDVSDSDVPDSLWCSPPRNTGRYNFPFRIIGDSVMLKKTDGTDSVKVLVTMGRWTVFHYKSKDYNNKQDPPAKNPRVASPDTMRRGTTRGQYPVLTYAVDISNYYDNLPMSLKDKNQVDAALMDTMPQITEPTLSLREVFELHPWTEMAERLEHYKDTVANPCSNLKYMEDHVMMAPTGAPLLLQTEQRYNYDHLKKFNHAESLLGYYMRDDNWSSMSATRDAKGWSRQDSMVWCGGWDADCKWYIYNPKAIPAERYTECSHPVSEEEDFLKVPAKGTGATDTVYYCLRARSKKTTRPSTEDVTVDGDYWFNICRYKIIYHSPEKYGPKKEVTKGGVTKALITKEEIEQRYDVLERLNFDYIQPGPDYHIYPHPLPWADASYGYTYPETSDLPHNRYHNESDFPNHGEYGLINRIPYGAYWRKVEQHGGAANGYMIYCDGMASAGQVAALTLNTTLCAGQKMFFSGYVGNPSSQTGKSNPNFIFSVQGSTDGVAWKDITSYMTGDIPPANEWYQIYFPILHNEERDDYTHFRVRIYNVAADFDGNDFIIDDMCIFATKPPLIAYQAQTTCNDYGHSDEETHVLLRVDYQGITGEGYNDTTVCYTVRQKTPAGVSSFVRLSDHYLSEDSTGKSATDTLYGRIFIPAKDYEPKTKDSIYKNMNDLLDRFDTTFARHKKDGVTPIVREGYIYEILEGDIRPVKYVVHSAKMMAKNDYTVHMSGVPKELLSSICGMTSHLKISNRMVLELNGEEQPETEQLGLCANATYDISLRVKGSMYLDSVAPIDVSGSCVNDWLLYGDTARESSKKRYGYYFSDIEKVVTRILRQESLPSCENKNQFVYNLASVDSAVMRTVQKHYEVSLDTSAHPYTILADLVNKGYLTLYQQQLTASVLSGDSLMYVIFPIVGSGSKEMEDARVEVCPNPIQIKLKPSKGGGVPVMIGGLNRDSTEAALPIEVLASAASANSEIKIRLDSIMTAVGIYTIELRSTDDPDFREGLHILRLEPDKRYPAESYYHNGDSIRLRPASSNNYTMRPGYRYTFNIVMQTLFGQLKTDDGCEVGSVPFTVSVVPDYVRWNPQTAGNNNWNDANNWLGINANNEPIHDDAHFVPMENTYVLIPAMEPGKPYPVVQPLPSERKDSIQKVGFQYNQCNTIRFLPGAAIGKQQYINTDVVVDMKLPNRKWAFRTSPVKGMIGGDLFTADAERNGTTPLWEVGAFDNSGRTYKNGYASYWLSVYNSANSHVNHSGDDSTRTVTADWSRVTNAMDHSLPAGRGFAVYVRTADNSDAVVRLPKNDDIYYYYGSYGERIDSKYEPNLQNLRNTLAGGVGMAGKMAYHPTADHDSITLTNEVESNSFVFGNYTMGYIDIWGFISDNPGLVQQFGYMNEKEKASLYEEVTMVTATSGEDVITNTNRYLPPMHVMVLTKTGEAATKLKLRLNTSRVVTDPSQVVAPSPSSAPRRMVSPRRKGIMRVTAKNAVSPRCTSHLLLGQGYHEEIVEGEDAILTTINIDNYTANLTPTTPFNLYSVADGNGMCIDLRDSIVNVPVSFYMSDLEYEPTTQLWFTGVNNIDGPLVLYDEWTDSERRIIDGICLTIETPVQNHQKRYFIRRPGYRPQDPDAPIATRLEQFNTEDEQAVKFIQDGVVLILRNGHIYTMFGQKVR